MHFPSSFKKGGWLCNDFYDIVQTTRISGAIDGTHVLIMNSRGDNAGIA